MLFRTDDQSKWGDGIGRNLVAPEVDDNFWELRAAVNDLIANPGAPVSIVSITTSGSQMTFNMSDGSQIGPVNLPVLEFHWRADWLPNTAYYQLDVFRVVRVGLFAVLQDHISAATFDPAAVGSDSNPLYYEMFGFAPTQTFIYDVGFYYPGTLFDVTSDVVYLYQEPLVRRITIPVTPTDGSMHQAFLEVAASTSVQTLNIYQNDVAIGTVVFDIGNRVGTVTLGAVTDFAVGDRLAVGKPTSSDATAAGLSIMFAAQFD